MKIFLDANICLDLLDSSRQNSQIATSWYMENRDDSSLELYFSGNFITTIYYTLTQKRKLDSRLVIDAISSLADEVAPVYLDHSDFLLAKSSFESGILRDFEDLMVLYSVKRCEADQFLTNDQELLKLGGFEGVAIGKIG